ncbi:MAG: hypothetical protein JSV80_04365 [Acidobacteriota bacterium]|nr:MAG: hypothetical protein JSV80_04365 [Acidobacteriota bacterium]
MHATRRLRLDRIASATANAKIKRDVILGPDITSRAGYVIAVKILNDKPVYNTIEEISGRLVPVRAGDVLAGVLGSRRALKGYEGRVPPRLVPGERVHVLNLGGVLGECTSIHPDLGAPFEGEVLGAVLDFPAIEDRIGRPAHIGRGAIATSDTLEGDVPIVFVAGTSMNAGKTVAATQIVRGLTRAGMAVGAVKLTGVALRRDALSMLDAGAVAGLTFTDTGSVCTDEEHVLPAARGLLNHLARVYSPDIIVAELGDGILGDYGVKTLLGNAELMDRSAALIVCAPDQVGAWGACRLLEQNYGLKPTLIAGPTTDTQVGCRFVRDELALPACNARRDPEGLASQVLEVVRGLD